MSDLKTNGNQESGVINPKNNQHEEKKLKPENVPSKGIEDQKEEKEKGKDVSKDKEKKDKEKDKDKDREKDKDKDKEKEKDKNKETREKDKERDKDKDKEKKKKKNKDSKKKKKKSKDRSRSRSIKKKPKKSRSRSRSRSEEKSRKRKRSVSEREKKKKKSVSSSYSRSPSKRKSKGSKSRSVSKRKRNFRFDSPPKDKNNLNPIVLENPILSAALTQPLPIQPPLITPIPNPQMPPPMPTMGINQPNQSPAELLQKIQMLNTLQNIQASKSDRKLYIGNLPANLTPQTLCDVLNSALQKMGVNTNPGNSIVSAWISNDGHYAFVEFRTPEEANNGFTLNNVALFGQHLKVGRPRTYAATQALSQGSLMIPGLNSVLPGLNPLNPLGNPLGGGVLSNSMFGSTNSTTIKVQPPSRILVLKNMIQVHELEIDEEYTEILEDVKEECAKYGEVLTIKIPRPKGIENVVGLGKIFVEFANVEQSKEARKNLAGRTFSSNTVECSYHDERLYAENNLAEI